jgi:hypothetical protein
MAPVVISLVLRLTGDPQLRVSVLEALRAELGVELGELREGWLPVVAEIQDPRELHAWLENLPGVLFVDVAFVEIVPEPLSQEPLPT